MTQNETQREKKDWKKTWTELQWAIHYLDLLSVHKFDNLMKWNHSLKDTTCQESHKKK